MNRRLISYRCPDHGEFYEWPELDAIHENVLCPQCQSLSCRVRETKPPPRYGEGPAVHGDVRRSYFSENLNCHVGSKRDIREAQKREEAAGFLPMSNSDLKTAKEKARNLDIQATRDRKWLSQATERGEVKMDRGSVEGWQEIA